MAISIVRSVTVRLFQILFGGFFLWSGWVKLSAPLTFSHSVRAYELLPEFMVASVAQAIPWAEVILGLGCLLGIWLDTMALGAFLLMCVFQIAIGWAMFQGLDIDCGCGVASSKVGFKKLFQNGAWMVGLWLLIRYPEPWWRFLKRR